MYEQMIIPPQKLEVLQPDPRVYDILEQMLNLQSQMLATFAPSMIYRTPEARPKKSEESPPCRS